MSKQQLRIFLPDGSLRELAEQLFREAGLEVFYGTETRCYLGSIRADYLQQLVNVVVCQFRPWDMPVYVADGSAHMAIAADDMIWNAGLAGDPRLTVLDHYPISRQGYPKTRLVVAVPNDSPIQDFRQLGPSQRLVTEYLQGAKTWAQAESLNLNVIECHGKLEAFLYFGLADAIIENTESGRSLAVNGWRIIHQIMESQTCLLANTAALEDPDLGQAIRLIQRLLKATVTAREYVVVSANVTKEATPAVRALGQMLPAGQSPTICPLINGNRSIEVVVRRNQLPQVLDTLNRSGVTSIFTRQCDHYIP